jgi:hypothetical protein
MGTTPGIPPLTPLQAQYLALVEAIGLGAKVVRFQDRTVEYQSTDEMIKAANWLYLKLAGTVGVPDGNGGIITGVNRQIRMYTDKGL